MEHISPRIQIYTTSQEAWDAMYAAVREAHTSIYWEIYTFIDDEAGKRFVDILIKKAQAGVQTKLIVDAMGCFSLSSAAIKEMKQAGVDVILFLHNSQNIYEHDG